MPRRKRRKQESETHLITSATAVLPVGRSFIITRVGMRIEGDPGFEEAAAVAPGLAAVENSLQLAVGDYANFMEDKFGEQAAQVLDADLGWSEATLANYRWVAAKVPMRVRQACLSFRHHQLVAKLSVDEQNTWLRRATGAADNDGVPWTVSRLAAALRDGADAPVTEVWLIVRCKDRADLDTLRAELEGKGRVCTSRERRAPVAKTITARAKGGTRRKGAKKR